MKTERRADVCLMCHQQLFYLCACVRACVEEGGGVEREEVQLGQLQVLMELLEDSSSGPPPPRAVSMATLVLVCSPTPPSPPPPIGSDCFIRALSEGGGGVRAMRRVCAPSDLLSSCRRLLLLS